MARPWKHPDSGIYWLRRAVPEDLRELVGKREEKRSLGTRDPTEAKRLHAQALSELELRWANLRAGPQSLNERECHELAMAAHDQWLEAHKDNPSDQTFWPVSLGETLWAPPPPWDSNASFDANLMAGITEECVRAQRLERWCLSLADECLSTRGLRSRVAEEAMGGLMSKVCRLPPRTVRVVIDDPGRAIIG